MRTMWKGHIQFSLVNIPIRLYSAVDSGKSISFDWLTKDEHHAVGYTKTDKETGEPLEKGDIVKGYEYEPDQYVIVEDEDFEKIKPKTSKAIKVEGFIDETETHPMLFDKPYFIGPESESGIDTYRLFTRTLKDTGRTAVGRVVLRNKESLVLLKPHEGGVLMYKLRFPNQLRSMKDVPYVDEEEEVDKDQLEMAKELVSKMTKSFSDIDMEDHYYQQMKEMIEAKIEGKEVVSVEEKEPETRDIMTALKESIAATGNGEKANGERTDGEQADSEKYNDDWTKKELYSEAEKADIRGRSKMDKQELIEALKKKK